MRGRVWLWHSGGECLLHRSKARAGGCFCNGAAMRLRLIEQACGCFTMRGGGGLEGACSSSLPLAECLPPPRPSTCRCLPLHRSRRETPTDRASLRQLHGARWSWTRRCVLIVSTSGARWRKSACRRHQVIIRCSVVHLAKAARTRKGARVCRERRAAAARLRGRGFLWIPLQDSELRSAKSQPRTHTRTNRKLVVSIKLHSKQVLQDVYHKI